MIFTLLLERTMAKGWIPNALGNTINVVSLLSVLVIPIVIVNVKHCGPLRGTIACSFYAVLFLKLWSYMQVNYWCRIKYSAHQMSGLHRSQTMGELLVKKDEDCLVKEGSFGAVGTLLD